MDYESIESAIRYVERNASQQPSLERVAEHVGLSPHHLQRTFKRWAGLSPKRFLQFLTAEHAKARLRDACTVLDTAYDVGLSGAGRLHDLFVSVEAVTPGEFKRRGEGTEIRYGVHPTPFGDCLLALTNRGICALWFDSNVEQFRDEWRSAHLIEDRPATRPVIERIFAGERPPLLLRGTNFQVQVWRALMQIPEGTTVSYSSLADAIGRPRATRAVASAVARNPISYLIPCHRVLRTSGGMGGYRWGVARKRAMLMREAVAGDSA